VDGEYPSANYPARYLHMAAFSVVTLAGDDGDAIGEA